MKKTVLCLLLALSLTGCAGRGQADSQEVKTITLFAMNTYMELRAYGGEAALTEAAELIHALDGALSVTDEGSEIYALNRDKRATLSPDAAELTGAALALCARTGGALDVSIYPVLRAWGFTSEAYRVPSEEELSALLRAVDYRRVRLSGSATELDADMMIDLGSVAKGFASGRVIALLRSAGVSSALVNLGGNVQTLGTKPDGSLWRVAIRSPFGDGALGVVEVADKAVITSGGYERFFEQDGETYWHILDPATGRPARAGLVSVTVVGEDALKCDGLSTALFVMGPDRAAALWRESDDFEAVLVTDGGGILITEGLEDSFTADHGASVTVLRR